MSLITAGPDGPLILLVHIYFGHMCMLLILFQVVLLSHFGFCACVCVCKTTCFFNVVLFFLCFVKVISGFFKIRSPQVICIGHAVLGIALFLLTCTTYSVGLYHLLNFEQKLVAVVLMSIFVTMSLLILDPHWGA